MRDGHGHLLVSRRDQRNWTFPYDLQRLGENAAWTARRAVQRISSYRIEPQHLLGVYSPREAWPLPSGENIQAVQVGGPSGACIGPEEFGRILGYEDLATGGSLIIIGTYRDLLKDVVLNFMEFFVDESCGSCAPCRILTVIFRDKLKKIIEGRGVKQDLEEIRSWAPVSKLNRCGLGQAALNPILSTLKNFPELYESRIQKNKAYDQGFDLNHAVRESIEITGRNAF